MEWPQESQIMDESFPVDLFLDSQSVTSQTNASTIRRDRRTSFPVVAPPNTENLRATLSAFTPHLDQDLDEDTQDRNVASKEPENHDSSDQGAAKQDAADVTIITKDQLINTPLSSKSKQYDYTRKRSQSKDSGDSYKPSWHRQIVTFRQRSKSEVDYKAINRKKYAHVKSKVKQHILQLEAESKKPLLTKQKSLPELQRSKKPAISPVVSENQSSCNDSGMTRQDSTNSISTSIAKELEAKERLIHELADYVTVLETNCQEKTDENYVLKKKVEQMRDKIHEYSERRASVPALNLGSMSIYESQFDSPFSSMGTPVRRVVKRNVSKCIQTSFRDDHHPYLNSDHNDGYKQVHHDPSQVNSSEAQMRRSKSEVMVNTADSTKPDTPKTAPPKYSSEDNFRRDKSLLEKSRSNVHRIHVSFRNNNSYQIFDETTTGTGQGASETNESSDVVVNRNNDKNVKKEKKLSIFRKILNCFRSQKK